MVPSVIGNHMQIPLPLQVIVVKINFLNCAIVGFFAMIIIVHVRYFWYISIFTTIVKLVQTTSSPMGGRETKLQMLQMTGNRSQLLELSNSKNLVSNVVMASDNNPIMLQTKPPNMKSGQHILKAVSKANQASLVKCIQSTANSIQPQQKIQNVIFANGINNNPATVIRKSINDRSDNSQTQNTVIHSRPATGVTTGVANGIGVSYVRQGSIQDPITMKTGTGQRTVIGQMPMQTITANPSMNVVYYQPNFSPGTFASSGQLQTQIRDAVNNNQQTISHHTNSKLSNGYQFLQLIPNTAMISQPSTMISQASTISSPAQQQHTAQLVTSQAPINSNDGVTIQKPERPAILKRQRPQTTTERRAPFGGNHPPCPKVPKVDVEPVHIKVAAGAAQVSTASPIPATMQPTTSSTSNIDQSSVATIASAVPINSSLGPRRNIPTSTTITSNSNNFAPSISKLSELSNSTDRTTKIDKTVLSSPIVNSPTQQPQSVRHESVICSPRKPRKQTLIRKEQQMSNGPPRLSDPVIEPKKLTDEVSTDEADEFEDEPSSENNPSSENRAENRLKLEISRDTSISSSTSSSSRRDKHVPTKRSNVRGSNHIILSSIPEKTNSYGFSSRHNPGKILIGSPSSSISPKSPKLDNHKSCVRLRIFGGQNTPSTSKKEKDHTRHFAKHSDVKLSTSENLTLAQLRLLTKTTSSKVDAVNKAVRQMQKDESSVYNILEEIKSKERGISNCKSFNENW